MRKQDISILCAEDEPSLQHVFASQLHALGYKKPEFVTNGLMAVKLAKQKRFDIIFMDLRMPELDGISATQRIREGEAGTGSRVPIVGLSAYSRRQNCLEAGNARRARQTKNRQHPTREKQRKADKHSEKD